MSLVGKQKETTRARTLSQAFLFENSHDTVEAIFHKDSYMKGLKALGSNEGMVSQGLVDEELEKLQLSEDEKTQLSKFLLDSGAEKWEHSQIYRWVDANAEARVLLDSQYKPVTKEDVLKREEKRYNDGLSWCKGEYEWVEVDENDRDPLEELAEGKFRLVKKKSVKNPKIQKSSYLSWILEPESPFSKYSRVFSLPPYEEHFWRSMLSRGNPEKGIDPGYLTLDKEGFNR